MAGRSLPRVKYVLVCDDIREEKSNKVIILGLYAGRIIVETIPTLLPKLAVRVCFDLGRPYEEKFSLAIRRPDGMQVGPFAVVVPPAASDEQPESCINLSIVPFPLDVEGIYEIVARGGDEEAAIGRFRVEALRSPKDTLS